MRDDTKAEAQEQEALRDEIAESAFQGDANRVQELYALSYTPDFADLLEGLEPNQLVQVLNTLTADDASDVLEELEPEAQAAVVEQMDPERLADLLDEMPSDEAADFVAELDKETQNQILELMEDEESSDVEDLLEYPSDSAGGIMAAEVVALNAHLTADEAIDYIRSSPPDAERPYYIYVIDNTGVLLGVVSLHRLLAARPTTTIGELMQSPVVTAQVDDDQEKVAQLMRRYDFVALPVVDEAGRLRGLVTHDDVMDVIEEELAEDFLRFAGTTERSDRPTPVFQAVGARLPVVALCLGAEVIAGSFVLRHEAQLGALAVLLAAFMPALFATGGNIGQQSLATVIRGIASDEWPSPSVRKALWRSLRREFIVGLVLGLCTGALLGLIVYVWLGRPDLALLLGVVLSVTSLLAALAGASIPLILKGVGIDPANASGPLITTLNDIASSIIYFSAAVAVLHLLEPA